MRKRAGGSGLRGEEIGFKLSLAVFIDFVLVRLTFYDPPGTGGGVSAKAFDYGASGLNFSPSITL
jgi:hypothetical protein